MLREIGIKCGELLLACAFNRPIILRDIPQLVECVGLHSTLLVVKAELDEIMKGLSDAGVLEVIQQSPSSFELLSVYLATPLTAGMNVNCVFS